MSKQYFSVSKNHFEKVAEQCDKTVMTLNKLIPALQSIETTIKMSEEEKDILKKAYEVIVSKLEVIEDLTEDPNNEFFNANNIED